MSVKIKAPIWSGWRRKKIDLTLMISSHLGLRSLNKHFKEFWKTKWIYWLLFLKWKRIEVLVTCTCNLYLYEPLVQKSFFSLLHSWIQDTVTEISDKPNIISDMQWCKCSPSFSQNYAFPIWSLFWDIVFSEKFQKFLLLICLHDIQIKVASVPYWVSCCHWLESDSLVGGPCN